MNSARVLILASLFLASACDPGGKSKPDPMPDLFADVEVVADEDVTEPEVIPEDIGPPEALCDAAGLSLDGAILLSADPLSTQPPLCESSWIHFGIGGGYEACCDEQCCEWTYNAIATLPTEGEACEPDVGCAFGLSCGGAAVDGLLCTFGVTGDPCDGGTLCGEGYFCGDSGLCKPQLVDEGAKCSGDSDCAWPLSCVCPPGALCRCYDGTLGDPCTSDTCVNETYCAEALLQAGVFFCHDGAAGDPCVGDWQCNEGFGCAAEAMGVQVCAMHLGAGAPCDDLPTSLKQCGPGFACNSALDPQVCAPLGTDGAPCAETLDCAADFECRLGLGTCWDGKDGDPCVADDDCAAPYTCVGDTHGECTWVLTADEICEDTGSPWIRCASNLVCNTTFLPDQCTVPGAPWDFCFVDGDCSHELFCLPGVGVCYEGVDGDFCEDDSWCRDGWHCHSVLSTCTDGDFGDPCDAGQCADGFTCHPEEDVCYDGSPGTPCVQDADCAVGVCVGIWDGAYCIVLLEPGGACGSKAAPFTTCGWGHVCVEPPGLCSAGLEGDACDSDAHCTDGTGCHPALGICLNGDLGDACSGAFPCALGFECHDETAVCVAIGEGVPCDADEDCGEDLFCVDGFGLCHDGDNGDPCAAPTHCAEGYDCLLTLGQCYDGGEGSPCLGDAMCIGELTCDPDDAVCVAAVE